MPGEGFLPSWCITSCGHCGSSEGRAVRMLLPGFQGKICYHLDEILPISKIVSVLNVIKMIVVKYGPSRLMPALYMPFQCALEINKFKMSGFGHIVPLSLHS